ncbi:MAG: acetate--CoA ligase family protein [Chloroflexales bacterium]|jgi:acetate---CoA ligase (ADP-forming)
MLETIFSPRSLAVVGASPDPERLGHVVLKNIIVNGYAGSIYPIHPTATVVLDLPAYPSITVLPEVPDLVVIVIPPEHVIAVVEECGKKGVKGLVVITAGFKEVGGEGKELERQLLAKVREYGMRMIGPNCLGIIDTVSDLNVSFAGMMPLSGEIALMSQSGAMCTAILDWSRAQGIGFSRFVSLGNKADVDEVALLHAWNRDPHSKVILAYLEGITDGPGFIAAAREVTKQTPVIAIKSGTTAAGTRAASSHTGSLAGSEAAYEAAFSQSGILRARTMNELFDLAMIFSYQPLIQGNRVAIITNAGGPGILATDAVERSGLKMASFTPETLAVLRANLPVTANIFNPIDIIGDARSDRYRIGIDAALADPNVDAAIILLTPQARSDLIETCLVIIELSRAYGKPVATSFMGGYSLGPSTEMLSVNKIPNYTFPERAVQSLSSMVQYSTWRQRPAPTYRSFEVDQERVRTLFSSVRESGRVELGEIEARDVIEAYGMRLPQSRLATSPDEAAKIAAEIGFPVVMKISSPDILHKSDIGGVKVGVSDASSARDTYELIEYRARKYSPGARIWGVLVQEMVRKGREMLVGVTRDPQFGPLVAVGMGGIYVEVLKDLAFRLAPISEMEASEQLRSIRTYPLLRGVRGEPPADIAAIEETVLRVSQLVTDFPEIVEMDINPLVVHNQGEGAIVLDARIILK